MRKYLGILFKMKLLILGLFYLWSPGIFAFAETTSIRTVGYLPDYDYAYIETVVDFSQLTDINYFSIIPQPDGKLEFTGSGSGPLLDELRVKAHKADVRVGVSIGGWGMSENFAEATSKKNLDEFVEEIVSFAKKYKLDTVDIDWEYPTVEEADRFTKFILALRSSLPEEVGLSICVPTGVAANGQVTGKWEKHFPPEALRAADWVNIMSYDAQVEGIVNHSPRELQKNSLNYWNKVMGGDQIHKLVGGVPFYGKAENGAVMTYGRISEEYGRVLVTDEVTLNQVEYHFNNKETIQGKTEDTIAIGALGIMIWAPTQDAALESSSRLMDVIDETIKEHNVILDKTIFATEGEKTSRKVSWNIFILVVSLLLVIFGVLFFKGRLESLLPGVINHKKVNQRRFGKVVGFIISIIGIIVGLTTIIPIYIIGLIILVIVLAVLYILKS